MLKAATHFPPYQSRERIAMERHRRGWSQEDLAEHIQTTRLNVSRWEHGWTTPSPHFRYKLCELFNLSAEELGLLPTVSAPASDDTAQQENTMPAIIDPAIPLPSPLVPLIGRDSERELLKQGLLQAPALLAVKGLPGIGKTALARELVYDPEVRDGFRAGILWAALGPSPDLQGLLKRWGTLLGISPQQAATLTTLEDWGQAIRVIIGQRKLLLVLDDVWQIEDALKCIVGGSQCSYLLTTRFPQIALAFSNGRPLCLRELDSQQSFRLLQHLAPTAAKREPALVQSLLRATGGLPLALTLIGTALRTQAHDGQPRRLRAALMRLQEAEARLQLTMPCSALECPPSLSSSSICLQAVIAASDRHLDGQAREALRALARAFPPKPESFSEEEVLKVYQGPIEVLDALCDAGLLESAGAGRYTLHRVIADYARLY